MRSVPAALAAALLTACTLLPQHPPENDIVGSGVWGCRDRDAVVDLLFLGNSAAFDSKLARAVADGTCVYFQPGEKIVVAGRDPVGLIRARRTDSAQHAYWTPAQNVR